MNPDTLNTLQTEHQCLLGQAEQIEEQLDRIRSGYDTDYVLLHDRIHFLKEHYIGVHCPKDKALVQKLLSDAGNLGAIMTPFLNAHAAAFLSSVDAMEADLQAVLSEQMVSREDLLQCGDRALHHLREQIATEETGPFPWARRRLEAQDWMDIARENGTVSRDRQEADCSEVGVLFPGLANRLSSETVSMKDAGDRCGILWFTHKDQDEGH